MKAREEILAAAIALRAAGREPFTQSDIADVLASHGVTFSPVLLDRLVTSTMVVGVEDPHPIHYNDFEVAGDDAFRLAETAGEPPVRRSEALRTPDDRPPADSDDATAFGKEMDNAIGQLQRMSEYVPYQLKEMIDERGAVSAAKRSLGDAEPSEGFATLYEIGRLDLSVEWLVLRYHGLFTHEERKVAHDRLVEHDVPMQKWLWDKLERRYP